MIKRRDLYKLDNRAKLAGKRNSFSEDINWYSWTVFVNEPKEKLNEIESVVYKLHKSFPNRVRVARNRENKFAISSEGWGEFLIQVTFNLINGRSFKTEYYLELASKIS